MKERLFELISARIDWSSAHSPPCWAGARTHPIVSSKFLKVPEGSCAPATSGASRTKKHIDIFTEVIKNLKNKGEKFWDTEFPADHTSLIRDWDSNNKLINEIREEWKEFKWMRADKIFKNKNEN